MREKTPQEQATAMLPLALETIERTLRSPGRNASSQLKAALAVIELAQDRRIGQPRSAEAGEVPELPPGVPPPPDPAAPAEEWDAWRQSAAELGYRGAS